MAVSKTVKDQIDEGLGANPQRTTAADVEVRIDELKEEIAALSRTLKAFGATKVDDYRLGLDRIANEAVDTTQRAYENAKSEAISLERNLENQIRAKPLQAVGIAVGVGFLAALLTRRH